MPVETKPKPRVDAMESCVEERAVQPSITMPGGGIMAFVCLLILALGGIIISQQRDTTIKNVLLVEDDKMVVKLTERRIMQDCPDCKIFTTCLALEAKSLLETTKFYRIVLDGHICKDENTETSIGGKLILEYILKNHSFYLTVTAVNSADMEFCTYAKQYGCRIVPKGGW